MNFHLSESCISFSSAAFRVCHFAPTSKSSAMKAWSILPWSGPSCAMLLASGQRCSCTRAVLKTPHSCKWIFRKVSFAASSWENAWHASFRNFPSLAASIMFTTSVPTKWKVSTTKWQDRARANSTSLSRLPQHWDSQTHHHPASWQNLPFSPMSGSPEEQSSFVNSFLFLSCSNLLLRAPETCPGHSNPHLWKPWIVVGKEQNHDFYECQSCSHIWRQLTSTYNAPSFSRSRWAGIFWASSFPSCRNGCESELLQMIDFSFHTVSYLSCVSYISIHFNNPGLGWSEVYMTRSYQI